MNIKLDENLPIELAISLAGLGHQVETVPDEGLAGAVDDEVWQASQAEGRFLITQDLDFSDIHKFTPGTHYGILLVRLHPATRVQLIQRVTRLFQTEMVEEWAGCLVVVTNRKVRVRHPDK